MFGFNRGNRVAYWCSTRLTASEAICVGLLMVVAFAGISVWQWKLLNTNVVLMLLFVMLVGLLILAWGLVRYYRPGMETRYVVLDNWSHRLFLGNKWLFVLFTGGVYMLAATVFALVLDCIWWLSGGLEADYWAKVLRLRRLAGVGLFFVVGALKSSLDYYYYYKWLRTQRQ